MISAQRDGKSRAGRDVKRVDSEVILAEVFPGARVCVALTSGCDSSTADRKLH